MRGSRHYCVCVLYVMTFLPVHLSGPCPLPPMDILEIQPPALAMPSDGHLPSNFTKVTDFKKTTSQLITPPYPHSQTTEERMATLVDYTGQQGDPQNTGTEVGGACRPVLREKVNTCYIHAGERFKGENHHYTLDHARATFKDTC